MCPTPLQEQQALKDQAKRLGKKGKDEVARLEGEMAARHAAELAALAGERPPTAADVVALAGSLYSVSLGGGASGGLKDEQQQQDQKVRLARPYGTAVLWAVP